MKIADSIVSSLIQNIASIITKQMQPSIFLYEQALFFTKGVLPIFRVSSLIFCLCCCRALIIHL